MGWVRKWWQFVVIILAVALVIGWEEERCQSQAYQCRADYTMRLPVGLPIDQQASEQQAIAAACEPNGYFCRLFSAANLPSVCLVLIGIGAIWAALRTLRAIENQRDVMINSERSWIMVEVEPVPGEGGILDGASLEREIVDMVIGNTSFNARITCKNDGKAPAWITEKHACLDVVDSLPRIPDWGRMQPIQVEPEPLSVGQIGRPKDEALKCKKPRELGKTVILYGVIKYRDVFSDNRTTTFGYKIRDDGALERLPYPKYNENT